jgi:hypothetical protein
MDNDDSLGKLFEALTLEKRFVEPMSPPFTGYGPHPHRWHYYGGPWPISNRRRGSSVIKNLPQDIEYRNHEDKLHRIYGPAYISQLFEIEAWFNNGKRHRIGGPAYIHKRNMVWFVEGKLHNLEGPAVVEGGGPQQYWIEGKRFTEKQYKWEITRRKRKGLIL